MLVEDEAYHFFNVSALFTVGNVYPQQLVHPLPAFDILLKADDVEGGAALYPALVLLYAAVVAESVVGLEFREQMYAPGDICFQLDIFKRVGDQLREALAPRAFHIQHPEPLAAYVHHPAAALAVLKQRGSARVSEDGLAAVLAALAGKAEEFPSVFLYGVVFGAADIHICVGKQGEPFEYLLPDLRSCVGTVVPREQMKYLFHGH